MAFSIKSYEADRLARQLAAITGESLTEAVTRALKERLQRHRPAQQVRPGTELLRIARELRKMPVLDDRSADEILGYDERGLPV